LEEPTGQLEQWIEGCIQNDRGSQKSMYLWLKELAVRICFRYTKSSEEVEELVNESFLKLFKSLHRFDAGNVPHGNALFKAWFKKIIVNTCIDHYRRKQIHPVENSISGMEERISDTAETGADKISYKEIMDAVRMLSPAYRTVFNLFVIEGWTHEEIAKELGISVGTSKSNLSKARENLRRFLIKKNQIKLYA
jgi:RNA polymerase sigma factor (sigma-70 family)